MIKAYCKYNIRKADRVIVVSVDAGSDFFGGQSPFRAVGSKYFNSVYEWLDRECEKRGWRLEYLQFGQFI
jgi:hypothetical protein